MARNPANRLDLDYKKEAEKFQKFSFPIIDAHSHINGEEAVKIYKRAAAEYGISLTYSMTHLEQIDRVNDLMEGRIRFITMPKFSDEEKLADELVSYMRLIEKFYAKGSRILKFWSPPRAIDYTLSAGKPNYMSLNSKRRQEILREASALKMVIMVHVGDPDTWFSTHYKNVARYGTKLDQYKPLEEALSLYDIPFIAAHMGGWPEDLDFLNALLKKHPNLYLDTSATKWIVRELSRHPREKTLDFFNSWRGRILFGSDIVSNEAHVDPSMSESGVPAYDLYASRYWALRTLFETDYRDKSPIADPDLAMIDPVTYGPDDSPPLHGMGFPVDLLEVLYYRAAHDLLEPYYRQQ